MAHFWQSPGGAIASLWLPAPAAFPAVFVNLGHGQNGFLTAGLPGVALVGRRHRDRARRRTYLAFNPELWWSFAASTETSRKLLLEQGDVGFEKRQSVFIRSWSSTCGEASKVATRSDGGARALYPDAAARDDRAQRIGHHFIRNRAGVI